MRDWGSFLWEGGVFKGLEGVEFFPGWYVNDGVVEVERVHRRKMRGFVTIDLAFGGLS